MLLQDEVNQESRGNSISNNFEFTEEARLSFLSKDHRGTKNELPTLNQNKPSHSQCNI